jgi:hypothetical protein
MESPLGKDWGRWTKKVSSVCWRSPAEESDVPSEGEEVRDGKLQPTRKVKMNSSEIIARNRFDVDFGMAWYIRRVMIIESNEPDVEF